MTQSIFANQQYQYLHMSRGSMTQKSQDFGRRNNLPIQFNTKLPQNKDYVVNLQDQLQKLNIWQKYVQSIRSPLKENEVYRGDIVNGKKEGFGHLFLETGDQYIGRWQADQMSGVGVYKFKKTLDGIEYSYYGEFARGNFNGFGKLVILLNETNGELIYNGNWRDGEKCGQGMYFYNKDMKTYYDGNWETDQRHGEGKFVYHDGEYQGMWNNGKRCGYGSLRIIEPTGMRIYQGQWNNDILKDGFITYANLEGKKLGEYKGQIKDGRKHGLGTFYWDGMSYQGRFQNDEIIGEGTFKNSLYEITADFKKQTQNVRTKIKYPNGDYFDGTSNINAGTIIRKSGKYTFANGEWAEGRFNDIGQGALIGQFNYNWSNGSTISFDS